MLLKQQVIYFLIKVLVEVGSEMNSFQLPVKIFLVLFIIPVELLESEEMETAKICQEKMEIACNSYCANRGGSRVCVEGINDESTYCICKDQILTNSFLCFTCLCTPEKCNKRLRKKSITNSLKTEEYCHCFEESLKKQLDDGQDAYKQKMKELFTQIQGNGSNKVPQETINILMAKYMS